MLPTVAQSEWAFGTWEFCSEHRALAAASWAGEMEGAITQHWCPGQLAEWTQTVMWKELAASQAKVFIQ